ncbi:type II TA system antitoxin MqsA family protein [Aliikangiella coralliicola]|uniref:Helix-turn-helix domain-containing protein n=1 Tax=Aliikangiella coralliicola TaxID=2592383 RepID=A0A545UFV1_9GAMM|nr:type II TA system antitoxin MqsA family protein [Aliikangiella coralliicola]TQV88352.1 helix-turn-helix domain-containing protein [Aliikangiella coralliicola]
MPNKIDGTVKPNCECCGSKNITLEFVDSKMEYNDSKKIILLPVKLPVFSCPDCGFEYTAQEAEQIKHNAICNHLGILNPHEITQLRESHGLSKRRFATLTGLGYASISRWESGQLLQSKANDKFLRLLSDHQTITRLQLITEGQADNSEVVEPTFLHVNLSEPLMRQANRFQL